MQLVRLHKMKTIVRVIRVDRSITFRMVLILSVLYERLQSIVVISSTIKSDEKQVSIELGVTENRHDGLELAWSYIIDRRNGGRATGLIYAWLGTRDIQRLDATDRHRKEDLLRFNVANNNPTRVG